MGILGLFKAKDPRAQPKITIATRSFLFENSEKANGFIAAAQSASSTYRSNLLAYLQTSVMADQYGGTMVRSSTGRESLVYGYLPQIRDSDRDYLIGRDTTAKMFAERPWTAIWSGFPTTYIDTLDQFFSDQLAIGALFALQAAYQEFYLHGGGLVYLETTSDPEAPLKRGDRPLRWCFVPVSQVVDQESGADGYILTQPSEKSPLLDHGIEYLSIYPTISDKDRSTPIRIHGSKFIPVNLDPKHQKWWRAPYNKIPFNAIHDTLWELRDLIFSRIRAHFQGDPIVVDVDLSEEAQRILAFESMSQEQRTALATTMETEIAKYNTGAKTAFAPVMGMKMRRLGSANLPDPKEDVMLLASRLSHGSPFPVKMVLASTKGNSDMGDQDIISYASELQQNYRNTWGYKHLSKMLLMGQIMGASGLRMQPDFSLPPPRDLDWPHIRVPTPRDAAFLEKTDAAIYREAQEMSLSPPPRIARKFAKDPRYAALPLWLAGKGRKIDGTSADPLPISPAPGGGPSSDAHLRSVVQDEISEHEEAQERRKVEEEPAPSPLIIQEAEP